MGKLGQIFRKIWGLLMSRPWNFSWVIKGKLAGSGCPMSITDLHWMKSRGIAVVVTLTNTPLPNAWIEELGLINFHVPLQDHEPPSAEQIGQIVNFINIQLSQGLPVVVHCAAGQGRTGTILASYFIMTLDISAEEAIKKVRDLRPRSIEVSQEISLIEYKKYLQNRKK